MTTDCPRCRTIIAATDDFADAMHATEDAVSHAASLLQAHLTEEAAYNDVAVHGALISTLFALRNREYIDAMAVVANRIDDATAAHVALTAAWGDDATNSRQTVIDCVHERACFSDWSGSIYDDLTECRCPECDNAPVTE